MAFTFYAILWNLVFRAKLVPLFGSLSRFAEVSGIWLCRKNIILA